MSNTVQNLPTRISLFWEWFSKEIDGKLLTEEQVGPILEELALIHERISFTVGNGYTKLNKKGQLVAKQEFILIAKTTESLTVLHELVQAAPELREWDVKGSLFEEIVLGEKEQYDITAFWKWLSLHSDKDLENEKEVKTLLTTLEELHEGLLALPGASTQVVNPLTQQLVMKRQLIFTGETREAYEFAKKIEQYAPILAYWIPVALPIH